MNKINIKYENLLKNVNSIRTNFTIKKSKRPKKDMGMPEMLRELRALRRSRALQPF